MITPNITLSGISILPINIFYETPNTHELFIQIGSDLYRIDQHGSLERVNHPENRRSMFSRAGW